MSIVTKDFDGIPRWIQVLPYSDGRLPSYSSHTKSSWLRLDLVERVEAAVCLGVGDEDQYEYGIRLYSGDKSYYASSELFKQPEASKVVENVLDAVSAAL